MKNRNQAGKGGARAVDVAALAGVHRSAVSIVLNGAKSSTVVSQAARERILKAAAELNYVPDSQAQRLAGGRDRRLLALLTPEMDFDVVARKTKAIQTALSSRGYTVPLHALEKTSGVDHAGFVAQLRRQRPAAIICNNWGLQPAAFEELEKYQEEGGQLICFDYACKLLCDQVIFDREENTYQAARHLLEQGHREIGLWMSGSISGPRLAGFRRALAEFGISENPDWLLSGGHYSCNEESGFALAEKLMVMKQRPTGLCIVNDYAAHACIAGLHRAGIKVPQDISVVGHDDLPIAQFGMVPLTTVSQPFSQIAESVVSMLMERIEGQYEGPPRTKNIRGILQLRSSTMPYVN